MNRKELNKFIQQSISEQNNASSIALTQLAIELMKHAILPHLVVIILCFLARKKVFLSCLILKLFNNYGKLDYIKKGYC